MATLLFNKPRADAAARASPRTAIIDIGSNSIRLVVYQGPARLPATLFNEKVMAGLGKGLSGLIYAVLLIAGMVLMPNGIAGLLRGRRVSA